MIKNLLLDCKKIFIIFPLLTVIMLVGAESIGIVVELGLTAHQHIYVILTAVSSPNHSVSSSVNVSTYVYHTIEKQHLFFKCHFHMVKKNPSVSPTIELLEAAFSCFANAENPNSTGIYPEMINFNRKIPLVIKSMRTQFKFTQGLI